MDCLFCKIRDREIPGDIVHEDERCLGFRDINPGAPTHILVIPKRHIATLDDLDDTTDGEDAQLMGHLVVTATKIARSEGLGDAGYRMVVNCREGGGQSVFHIHVHILGGRRLAWPPG